MSDEEKPLSSEEQSNLLKEMEIWISLYKFYFDFTLKANAIFYGIAGAVAAFVLSHHGKETFRPLSFALWIPAFLGLILTFVSLYGSKRFEPLDKRVKEIMENFTLTINLDVKPLECMLSLTGFLSSIITVGLFLLPFVIPCSFFAQDLLCAYPEFMPLNLWRVRSSEWK